ncbi:MAG: hypothetical protein ABJN26_08890 [Stappiaceae bacterium]
MAAALTIAILLALSVSVVRIASVAMRLTGLPENIARFQCLSALTGTGFTTHESEMIVNYPIRRRILVFLMILGNLGLVSVSATFIVAMVDVHEDTREIVTQVLTIVAAIGVVVIMTWFKPLDRFMCDIVGRLLMRFTDLGKRRYQRILQLDDGYSIAEHVFHGQSEQSAQTLASEEFPLRMLAVRSGKEREFHQFSDQIKLSPGDVLICYGRERAHDALEDRMELPAS